MKIATVEGFHLAAPLRRPEGNALGFRSTREALLLRLTTDSGVSGWGEAGPAPHGTSAYLNQVIAPALIGRDAQAIGPIWHDLMKRRGYDRQGVAVMAISAVDIALHDLVAQARGLSVAEMLGGALRTSHFAYASGPYLVQGEDPYAGFLDEIQGFVDAGFRAVKPRVGGANRATVQFVQDLRRRLGDGIALMIDLNGGYAPPDAQALLADLADVRLIWAEEPVALDDLSGNARVARTASTPIATGESLSTVQAFRALMEQTGVSIIQPDLTVCGGYTGMQHVVGLARAYDVTVIPHVWGSVVGFQAALQMIAVLPDCPNSRAEMYPWVELDCAENPFMTLQGTVRPDARGRIELPNGKGLGLELLAPEHLSPWLAKSWRVC
ncbi:mandelate racemase/muconate lactonizing enzyme family protein [Mesorhizobium sp. M1B.F.Ca.ET.045.04.1.1]|uniref:mandelate racemase/muconate lactonizing enzyme family protein n=1 Tax=Mesorhizobium sp. M1B.F.Ca.ET.045.04.1.1 TaxID=2493673 RepID=UPI000F75BD7F|nr:mandelate racemase/muconate lactonizing enzyme family protein [Mesorhizobium sp. M1B.F.Ca.ET.045.04.1.1]AZO32263.1 mandelate racemase/muconate lactonizing enzyme family protein [Mesorhizobium sp. M1B.F.Ca.ET.045.04.1.1]